MDAMLNTNLIDWEEADCLVQILHGKRPETVPFKVEVEIQTRKPTASRRPSEIL